MRAICLLLSVVLLSFCIGWFNAATIHVPVDQPMIWEGLNAAKDSTSTGRISLRSRLLLNCR
jgi:hypothetical protein